MHIVPKNKFDMEACKRLSKATDKEVIANLGELLGWTADVNWPVASHVIDRVKVLGDEIVLPLKNILSSADDTWKYFVIVHLLPGLREGVFSQLECDLQRIVSKPTDSEVLEEVYLETKDLLIRRNPRNMAQIDILTFIKDGTFDVLKTGQTRDWVLKNFPLPDDFDDGESYRSGEFEIFNYGDFELHFSHDTLFLIFADYEGQLEPGKSLRLTQKWIFERDTSELSLPFVMLALKDEGIGFTTEKNDTLYSFTLKLDSKVELHFESDESYEPEDYGFVAFWIMDKSLLSASSKASV